jgi:Flp pilus assembly pilin Flp
MTLVWIRTMAAALASRLARTERGATAVEYALMLFASTVAIGFVAYKNLGRLVSSG